MKTAENTTGDIKVSVLLFVYNHKKYIRACIESILNQRTDFDFELLVHDDASSDGSTNIIQEFQKKYPNKIKSVIQKENQFKKGKFHVEENLFSLIKGQYVALIEGDDYWCDENKLQVQYNAMNEHLDCSMCVHKTQCVDIENNKYNRIIGQGLFPEGKIKATEIFDTFFEKNIWAFQTSSYFIRTKVFMERPYFWKKFYVGDLPNLIWAAHRGDFYFIDRVMSCYRMFVSGSATDMNRDRKFQLHKVKTNAEGLIAFNDVTNRKYWGYIKHIIYNYVYQYYKGTGKIIADDLLLQAKKRLTIREKMKLSLKYTSLGYKIRNAIENRNKRKLEQKISL